MLNCCIAVLLYCCIAVLLYCCIAVLLYCCIAVLLYCSLLFNISVPLRLCVKKTLHKNPPFLRASVFKN